MNKYLEDLDQLEDSLAQANRVSDLSDEDWEIIEKYDSLPAIDHQAILGLLIREIFYSFVEECILNPLGIEHEN